MIGAYVPGRTWLHRTPFAAKLAGLVAISLAAGWSADWRAMAVLLATVIAAYAALGRRMLARLADLRPLWPMVVVVLLMQGLLESWGVAAATSLRIVAMVALASLVTYTTTTGAMLDTLAPLFGPLRHVGISPRVPALAIALVIRLVPMLLELWNQREEAWRARTGRRASIRLVPSFLVETLALADHMAEALDARGFDPSPPPRSLP